MKTPINTVVPQPGATLPYSEFSGLRMFPNRVWIAMGHLMINVDRYFVTLRNIIGQVDTPRVNGNGR